MILRLAFFIILIPSLLFADAALTGEESQTPVSGGDCLDDTYLMSYDGDHPTATDYACYDSGNSSEDAAANTADSVNSDYIEYNAQDEHVSWTITGDISNLDNQGTLFVSFQTPDESGGSTGSNYIFEIWYDADNYAVGYINSSGAFNVQTINKGGAVSGTYTSACNTSTGWVRVGYTWKAGTGHDCSCVALGNGENWENEDADNIATWDSDPTTVTIGEKDYGGTVTDKVRVKDMVITSGYQDTDILYP